MPGSKEVDVVIVGAGIAGISAADELLRAGICNLVVLEAQDRPGGRIQSLVLGEGEHIRQSYINGICLFTSLKNLESLLR